ncbi:hypothetical protein B0T10DRAFT_460208 [Thelonectria olida]|uniref:Uncharacterized protein n=1 Tax=Thelonectria olida TaxID=1576542 RepID=A0A9P8W3R6_9HYPO|nr:hypothetical protein B0T10DRAFT_460208 [Thelonectria olida]
MQHPSFQSHPVNTNTALMVAPTLQLADRPVIELRGRIFTDTSSENLKRIMMDVDPAQTGGEGRMFFTGDSIGHKIWDYVSGKHFTIYKIGKAVTANLALVAGQQEISMQDIFDSMIEPGDTSSDSWPSGYGTISLHSASIYGVLWTPSRITSWGSRSYHVEIPQLTGQTPTPPPMSLAPVMGPSITIDTSGSEESLSLGTIRRRFIQGWFAPIQPEADFLVPIAVMKAKEWAKDLIQRLLCHKTDTDNVKERGESSSKSTQMRWTSRTILVKRPSRRQKLEQLQRKLRIRTYESTTEPNWTRFNYRNFENVVWEVRMDLVDDVDDPSMHELAPDSFFLTYVDPSFVFGSTVYSYIRARTTVQGNTIYSANWARAQPAVHIPWQYSVSQLVRTGLRSPLLIPAPLATRLTQSPTLTPVVPVPTNLQATYSQKAVTASWNQPGSGADDFDLLVVKEDGKLGSTVTVTPISSPDGQRKVSLTGLSIIEGTNLTIAAHAKPRSSDALGLLAFITYHVPLPPTPQNDPKSFYYMEGHLSLMLNFPNQLLSNLQFVLQVHSTSGPLPGPVTGIQGYFSGNTVSITPYLGISIARAVAFIAVGGGSVLKTTGIATSPAGTNQFSVWWNGPQGLYTDLRRIDVDLPQGPA